MSLKSSVLSCCIVAIAQLSVPASFADPASQESPLVVGIQSKSSRRLVSEIVRGERAVRLKQSNAIVSQVTLSQDQLFGQVFLYGSDLQYSSIGDAELSLIMQSLALGHVPCTFRVVGDTLQLVADQSIGFESDVNHPERLLHEFKIVSQTALTLTIEIRSGSPTLATVLEDGGAARPRTSWIRSIEFDPHGDYLLFESSIESAKGDVAEFMESMFPRKSLVPEGATPLLASPEFEPLAERYRFLSWGEVFLDSQGTRIRTDVASRYALSPGQTIDWYVTQNAPDEYLPQIRTGIEGWNRYFQAMWGVDGLKFKGKLPDGIKIGDPRYNVVNWDSVADAGAAYESQASDPTTGIQSHSLIYMPLAWINIGRDYWKNGEFSDAANKGARATSALLAARSYLGKALPVHCLQDATMHLSLEALQSPDDFARELFKGVLFHEVGHALGLDHNFKGSLSFNTNRPGSSVFSTSIMDYNTYSLERGAYESVESDRGPLLEYDRQILSVLYNGGADVKASDPVLAACGDEESDSVNDGVDPLCIRYDMGKDPTQALARAISLVTRESAHLGSIALSLPAALKAMTESLGDPVQMKTTAQLDTALSTYAQRVVGLVGFYFASGSQSINYLTRANLRSLQVFQPDVLPSGYVENEMRQRAWDGLEFILSLAQIPAATEAALSAVEKKARTWALKTPALIQLTARDRERALTSALGPVQKIKARLTDPAASGVFTRVRTRVLSEIARVPSAPFYFGTVNGVSVDYEAKILSLLEGAALSPINDQSRAFAERNAAITALVSFADVSLGQDVIERVRESLTRELGAVSDARAREELRALLGALQ